MSSWNTVSEVAHLVSVSVQAADYAMIAEGCMRHAQDYVRTATGLPDLLMTSSVVTLLVPLPDQLARRCSGELEFMLNRQTSPPVVLLKLRIVDQAGVVRVHISCPCLTLHSVEI